MRLMRCFRVFVELPPLMDLSSDPRLNILLKFVCHRNQRETMGFKTFSYINRAGEAQATGAMSAAQPAAPAVTAGVAAGAAGVGGAHGVAAVGAGAAGGGALDSSRAVRLLRSSTSFALAASCVTWTVHDRPSTLLPPARHLLMQVLVPRACLLARSSTCHSTRYMVRPIASFILTPFNIK